jgi:hypothetical protein
VKSNANTWQHCDWSPGCIDSKHGCKPVPELPKRWPLGLDRIKQIWEANAKGHLVKFFCDIAKDYELWNMVSQYGDSGQKYRNYSGQSMQLAYNSL